MPSRAIAGTDTVCHELVKALGIEPSHVRSVLLKIRPDDAVVVTLERYTSVGEIAEVTEVVKRYRLHLIEDEESTGVWDDDGGRVVPGENA